MSLFGDFKNSGSSFWSVGAGKFVSTALLRRRRLDKAPEPLASIRADGASGFDSEASFLHHCLENGRVDRTGAEYTCMLRPRGPTASMSPARSGG